MPVVRPIPDAAVEPVLIRPLMYDDRIVRHRLDHDAVVHVSALVSVSMVHVLVNRLRPPANRHADYRERRGSEQHRIVDLPNRMRSSPCPHPTTTMISAWSRSDSRSFSISGWFGKWRL